MLSPEQFVGFLGAAVLLTLAPGPDNLMVLALGASRGRTRGMAFGLGCALGCLSHTLLAAIGVSAVIAASPMAFTVLKVLGGLYLLRLGWQALRSGGSIRPSQPDDATESPLRMFSRGLAANAINPKVVMFFLAFLPQFVVATRGDTAWQIVQLGLIFTAQAAVIFGVLGYFAGAIGQWMSRHEHAGLWLDRVAGTVLVGLGLKLLVSR